MKFYRLAILITSCYIAISSGIAYSADDAILSDTEYYNNGMYYIADRNYNRALDSFENLQKNHPYSKFAKQSIILQAFLCYITNQDDKIDTPIDFFTKLYPFDSNVPYMLHLQAMSKYGMLKDESRISNIIVENKKMFEYIVKRYPDTEYAKDSMKRIKYLNKAIQLNAFSKAEWHYKNDNYVAAISLYSKILSEYSDNLDTEIKNASTCRMYELNRIIHNNSQADQYERICNN